MANEGTVTLVLLDADDVELTRLSVELRPGDVNRIDV